MILRGTDEWGVKVAIHCLFFWGVFSHGRDQALAYWDRLGMGRMGWMERCTIRLMGWLYQALTTALVEAKHTANMIADSIAINIIFKTSLNEANINSLVETRRGTAKAAIDLEPLEPMHVVH